MVSKNDYLETAGPVLFNCINDIELAQRSFLLQDSYHFKMRREGAITWILSNVNECQLDLLRINSEEITYLSDDLQVKALMMTPHHEVKRIDEYICEVAEAKLGRCARR